MKIFFQKFHPKIFDIFQKKSNIHEKAILKMSEDHFESISLPRKMPGFEESSHTKTVEKLCFHEFLESFLICIIRY